jgi:hypothetical protein
MNWGKILAYTQVVLSVGASIGYFKAGNIRMGLYWFFAAGITSSVTF